MSKANPNLSPSNPNPNPDPAMNSENRVDVTTARILRNQHLSFARGPESFQSLNSSPEVQRRVIALREIQGKHDEFEVEYSKEKAALDAKYQKIYHPLYEQRFKIVTGEVEVEGNDGTQNKRVERDEDKGISSFWLVAMKNNKKIAKAISEKDEAALAFLTDIEWSRVEPENFKIDFFFEKTNPFFSNPVLTKTYYMLGEKVLLRTTGSVIEWYPGKSLTENTTRKKVAKRAEELWAKNKKPMTESEEESFSFFNFFSPLEVLRADHPDAEKVKLLMQQDYRIGITIRDKIIPHALYWYTGEAYEDDEIIDCPDSDDDQFKDIIMDNEDDDDYYDDDKDDDDDEDDDDYEDDEDDEYEDEDEDYNDGNYQQKSDSDDDDNAGKRRKTD